MSSALSDRSGPPRLRMGAAAARLVARPGFEAAIVGVILLNAVVLGMETYPSLAREHGATLHTVNDVCLAIFVVELGLRVAAHAGSPRRFLRSGWNVFDLVVVLASFAPGLRENATLLRLVRLLRIVRVVRLLPDLRVLTLAVARSLPGVFSLALMTVTLIYVYGMIGWLIFRDHDPERFGSIGPAMLTMFILLTLENLPAYLERGLALSDWTVLFFVSYVLLASFLVFNLFIGVVISSMERAREASAELERREHPERDRTVEDRVRALRAALDELERELARR